MPDLNQKPQHFSRILLKWDRENNSRQMPWKGEKDPYKIWLSEIILQQTRVEQGLDYYERFIKTFPNVDRLATAPENKVFKLWEGLGYYSRCRNLITTARHISTDLKGKFPDNYEEIRKLKGVGPYTAAAISSFAFNLPHAVVDGNVYRVLARIFGISKPVDSTEGKKFFSALANKLLDKQQPGLYNQAIMDFGAVICKPAPICDQCPFQKYCIAYSKKTINKLPVKDKKIKIKKRWFYYLVMECNGRLAIRQRIKKDVWQQLYEFPLIETDAEKDIKTILAAAEKQSLLPKNSYQLIATSPVYKQQLSHQLIGGQFILFKLNRNRDAGNGSLWVERKKLGAYAFPKLINNYLEKNEFIHVK